MNLFQDDNPMISDQPNILLIITDQQTADAMSCAGNPYLKTPAMDSLGAHGTRFERAYAVQPLCLPWRSALQTARYPHEIGTVNNGSPIVGEFPMLGKLMSAAGYDNKYIGKWHVGTSFEAAGYDDAEDLRPDDRKTAAAVEYLKGGPAQPFFLTVSYINPHNVCQLSRDQELPDGPISPPPTSLDDLPPLPANFAVPPDEPIRIREVQKSIRGHYPTADWDELKWRQYLWGYCRLVEKVDAEIGQVLDALRDGGHEEDTLVIFVSDHGEGVAMHHWNQKQILYDQATRVPFIISWKGRLREQVSRELADTAFDITSTILDFAGVAKPESMYGQSLRPLITGQTQSIDRDCVVVETMFAQGANELGLEGRMLRTDRYKYCVYDRGENREQLFDMDADPGEENNLAADKEYADVLLHHRRLIANWAVKTSDAGFAYI